MKSADSHEPEYSWNYHDEYPHHSEIVGVGRTLAVGSFVCLCMRKNFWSQTSDHLIVHVDVESCYLAIPAKIMGELLVWLRDRAKPPFKLWYNVVFWLGRPEDEVWVWFGSDSPEAYGYLPWLKEKGRRMMAEVMNS